MKKMLWLGIGIVGMSVASIQAEEAKAEAAAPAVPAVPAAPAVEKKHAPKPELKDLTVVGKIEKSEQTNKKTGVVVPVYKLVTAEGVSYNLNISKKKNSPTANVADLVGSTVKIVGKGVEGKRNMIAVVTSLDKVDAAAAPAAK